MRVCLRCGGRHGDRPQQFCQLVTARQLANPEFVRDVRNFAASKRLPRARLLDTFLEALARVDACFINEDGHPITLRFDCLLPTDQDIDRGRGKIIEARIQNWLEETFTVPVPSHVTPHVRVEARERFRVIATILRAAYPQHAMMWGVRAANDNSPPIPPAAPEPRA